MNAERADAWLAKLLPVVLGLLIVYLYVKLFTDLKHGSVIALEYGLVTYFLAELVVKRRLCGSWRQFFAEHWLKLVLVLPFLRVFRVLSGVGVISRSLLPWLRALPYVQKLSKLTMLTAKLRPILLAWLGYLSLRRRRREAAAIAPPENKDDESG